MEDIKITYQINEEDIEIRVVEISKNFIPKGFNYSTRYYKIEDLKEDLQNNLYNKILDDFCWEYIEEEEFINGLYNMCYNINEELKTSKN